MRYDAVVFDLFGTLVPTPAAEPFLADHRRTAAALGVDPNAYIRAWYTQDMSLKRSIGIFPTIASAVRAVCDGLGVQPDDPQIDKAVAGRMATTRDILLAPRDDALTTLDAIAAAGLKRGLISDCNDEVVQLWDQTPFVGRIQAAVFSCKEGIKKPDQRLYELASSKLGLSPDQCLFVGDGACPELTGAMQAGMDAVLICPPAEMKIIRARQEGHNWTGPVIQALSEILELL